MLMRCALAGLGLLAGAVLPCVAAAQVTPRDTVRPRPPIAAPIPAHPDTIAKRDTSAARPDTADKALPADTVKAPIARADAPTLAEAESGYRWDREALFASGALTLSELLERVPGAMAFRTSWIASAQTVAFLGDPARVRIFLDGVEIDALDPRSGGILDLAEVPIWTLEELRVERGAGELRVHLRSWRHDRTIPNTRTDIATGDESTNLYRGYFARRYRHGEALQLAGQQYSTSQPRTGLGGQGSGGRGLGLLARVGWARGPWSADAFLLRDSRTRTTEIAYNLRDPRFVRILGRQVADSIPALRATRTDVYLRGAYGDPEQGPWLQVIAASSGFREATSQSGNRLAPLDTATNDRPVSDTARSRAQYVLTGGVTRWGVRLSAASRVRIFEGMTVSSPMARGEVDLRFASIAARLERDGLARSTNLDAGITATPLRFLALAAAVERRQRAGVDSGRRARNAARAEGALRIGGAWIVGGALYRDSLSVAVPRVYLDTAIAPAHAVGAARGAFGGVRGRVYKDVGIDLTATRWSSAALLRPMAEARAEVYIRTRWLSRFPRGQFGLNAAAIFEYRSTAPFRTRRDEVTTVRGAGVPSTLLEIRIRNAVVTWQYRNLADLQYGLVPGYMMPRPTNLYGVRWDFFN